MRALVARCFKRCGGFMVRTTSAFHSYLTNSMERQQGTTELHVRWFGAPIQGCLRPRRRTDRAESIWASTGLLTKRRVLLRDVAWPTTCSNMRLNAATVVSDEAQGR